MGQLGGLSHFCLATKHKKMKKREAVVKIMTRNPISVNLSNEVNDVVELFKTHDIHHIPVVSGDKLIGMISKADIDRVSYVDAYQADSASTAVFNLLKLEQVMTHQVVTVEADDAIRDAAALLATGKYHALPVLEHGKLVGILTSTDVINYLLEQY